MSATDGAVQGATLGSTLGPWGLAIGAAAGAGASMLAENATSKDPSLQMVSTMNPAQQQLFKLLASDAESALRNYQPYPGITKQQAPSSWQKSILDMARAKTQQAGTSTSNPYIDKAKEAASHPANIVNKNYSKMVSELLGNITGGK